MLYFEYSEFDCPLAGPGSGKENMKSDFLTMLDASRKIADIPFKINSGYRNSEHNRKIGGVKNSEHLNGRAADIRVTDSVSRQKILAALIEVGFSRIGIANSFIHADNSETKPKAVWLY